jgi:hypothetical protein
MKYRKEGVIRSMGLFPQNLSSRPSLKLKPESESKSDMMGAINNTNKLTK